MVRRAIFPCPGRFLAGLASASDRRRELARETPDYRDVVRSYTEIHSERSTLFLIASQLEESAWTF
jgi:hypothetical protein